MQKTVKQFGIGLLELMLVLAIIAIILVIATRFYEVANRSRSVNAGFQDLQTVTTAAHSWWEDHGKNFKELENMRPLIQKGYLSERYAHNPWGGLTTIKGLSADEARISMKKIETKACNALVMRLGLPANLCILTIGPPTGGDASLVDLTFCTTGSKKYAACTSQ